ncbi:hypothetical protein HBI56_075210 [Parastagonospora nodorum]|nr:hypothetical protein HBH52_060540 [Parastagonospora nodorum]KAH3985979.1 hypothetical protein HBH51_019370 [Parastagonospora nodorum]KAH4003290.1 hypothetical protein HBI10_058530 [Parastagonospora nodorum]KAH4029056.1 hypothetical protein HBI13_043830 [Parastagonospora nodorum]KAH4037948.1 hypothetical protein HBI09_061010 [Parastagonospora nodorum]
MSSAHYDGRYHHHQRPDHDSYYSRHERPVATARREELAMRDSPSSYSPADYSYEPRAPTLPRRSAAPPQYPSHPSSRYARKQTWPPSPSVEDETAALTKEVVSQAGAGQGADGEPPAHSRGSVDQEALLEDMEDPDDRRYVLVSDPSIITPTDHRRRSFAERGNMAHIKTDVADPPMFTERVSTPYAYTKPQRESIAPSRADFPSPDTLTPISARTPRTIPGHESRHSQRDQNARPPRPSSSYGRQDSYPRPSPTARDDVFDDSDMDADDTTHLRTTERKPARYSFVKSDLQKDDMRTDLRDNHSRPPSRRCDHQERAPPALRKDESSGSSRDASYAQSPRSSSSSLNNGTRKSRPAPVDTGYYSSSRAPSRPSSPLQRAPSPKLPSRVRDSPSVSRPSSRGNTRPTSPMSFSTTLRPPSPGRVPITDADWHSTYPPPAVSDRSRPPSRMTRYDSMPDPTPRIDVQSPSPARHPTAGPALPYPVDDRPLGVFMPSEAQYQFDHSSIASPRQTMPDSPRIISSPVPESPRYRDEMVYRPKTSIPVPEDSTHARRVRSSSVRSQAPVDERRERSTRLLAKYSMDRPLPSCPRSTPTTNYDDWYSLLGQRNFDVCPSCYEGVFADTPFAVDFAQTRRGERPTERFCDFSSSWTRLAWLLTIEQRRSSLELLHALADIAGVERPCPDDVELRSDRFAWYGIPDQRDGVHVANFTICSADKRMIEALLPTMRGYFTRLPSSYTSSTAPKYMCNLRTSSRRFPKYLDLLVELDREAQDLGQRPNISRFIQLARENAFKDECAKDKAFFRKPWIFIPSLPEFTVCEECYDELIWPACQSKITATTIPRLFNKTMQLVPNEDPEAGSSCCLYSSRMRRVFDISVKEADFAYLKRKALERKKAEVKLARERKGLMNWMLSLDRGSSQWERAKSEIKALDREWATWE